MSRPSMPRGGRAPTCAWYIGRLDECLSYDLGRNFCGHCDMGIGRVLVGVVSGLVALWGVAMVALWLAVNPNG